MVGGRRETRLAEAVAARPPGESALAAFRRALLAEDGLLARADTGAPPATCAPRSLRTP